MTNKKDWRDEFRKLWGGYPRNKEENTQGLDALVESFIAKTRHDAVIEALEEVEAKVNNMAIEVVGNSAATVDQVLRIIRRYKDQHAV